MKINLRTKSNLLFAQIIALGAIIFFLLSCLILKIYSYAFSAAGEFALKKANVLCSCQALKSGIHPNIVGFLMFIGAALLLTIIIAISRVIFFSIKTNSFVKLQKIKLAKNYSKLNQLTELIGITGRVEEVETEEPIIFCYGIIKPKIRISSKVIHSLSFQELRAVLLHETQHLISFEPARLLVIKFINTFQLIPGIRSLTKKYLSFSELAADELATNNFTERTSLALAMRKILELEEKSMIQKGMALSYFSQITEDRIRALSETNYIPTFRREIIKVSVGIMAATIISLYFSSQIKAQTIYTNKLYTNSPCANQETKTKPCDNKWTNCQNNNLPEKNSSCEIPKVWITNNLTK